MVSLRKEVKPWR